MPAVEQQTNIYDSMILSKFEHVFEKLESRAAFTDVKRKAFINNNNENVASILNNFKSFEKESCKTIFENGKKIDNFNVLCLGKGDCIKSCPQKAIELRKGKILITDLCNGCGKCISYCPQSIISLVDLESPENKSFTWPAPKGYEFWKICYKLLHTKK